MKANVKIIKNKYYSSFEMSFMTSERKCFYLYGVIKTNNKYYYLECEKSCKLFDINNATEIDVPEPFIKKIILYIFENHDYHCHYDELGTSTFSITVNHHTARKIEKKLYIKYMIVKQIFNALYNFFGYKFKQDYVISLKPKARIMFSFYSMNDKKTSDITNAKAFDSVDACKAFIEEKMKETKKNVINSSKKVVPYKRLKFIKISE